MQVSLGEVNVAQLCEAAADQLYILAPCQGCIHVVLATSCMPADVLMAYVHARVLALVTTQNGGNDQVICLATYLFTLHVTGWWHCAGPYPYMHCAASMLLVNILDLGKCLDM